MLGVGQIATGYVAIGQVVLAYYGLGQIGLGEFIWTMSRRDAEAGAIFPVLVGLPETACNLHGIVILRLDTLAATTGKG